MSFVNPSIWTTYFRSDHPVDIADLEFQVAYPTGALSLEQYFKALGKNERILMPQRQAFPENRGQAMRRLGARTQMLTNAVNLRRAQ